VTITKPSQKHKYNTKIEQNAEKLNTKEKRQKQLINICGKQINGVELFVNECCLSAHGMSVIKLKTRTIWQQLGK